jgi:hypothetical protein
MQENKNLVEEALIQMKNVEDVIAENAKGILASTMKEEISQLVKESLSEQDEDELDTDNVDSEEEVDVDLDMSSDDEEGEEDVEVDFDASGDSDMEEPIDLTSASDEEILRVFKAMGEDDGIIVKKDDEMVHLKDNEQDAEYLIKLGESYEENHETMEYNEEVSDDKVQDVIDAIFSDEPNMSDLESDVEMDVDDEEVVYEIEFNEEDEDEMMESDVDLDMSSDDEDEMMESDDEDEMMESDNEDEMMESDDEDEMMESDDEDEMMESDDEDEMMESDDEDEMMESYSHKKAKKKETKEGKKSIKPKGVGIGSGPKFTYKNKVSGGFKEDKKEGPKTMGTGKAKFEYKKGENMEAKSKVVKKVETKEAARGYAFGPKGLRKGITNNRNLKNESLETEVVALREKNEEYRKALNVFREKLNEVAIFNSNLAYATRIFTEHSTTKKEKINILRRFDNVQSLKESKSLYRAVKDELTQTETKSINETVENKLVQNVQTGSSTTLIENKTYEAPQFLRIKDLMSKLK